MKEIFKWQYRPSGNCPVQSEGWFLNHYFYFRSRGESSTIEFYDNKGDFYLGEDSKCRFKLKETKKYVAGWLTKRQCTYLVFKGCLRFMLRIIKSKITPKN